MEKIPYCRSGSYTKSLLDFPYQQKALYSILSETNSTSRIVKTNCNEKEVTTLLNLSSFSKWRACLFLKPSLP